MTGPVLTTLPSSKVNSTHWKWVYRCQNCVCELVNEILYGDIAIKTAKLGLLLQESPPSLSVVLVSLLGPCRQCR